MTQSLAEPDAKKRIAAPRRAKARILLIDDDPRLGGILKIHLEKEGYAVFRAANGEEGLAVARKRGPDLVILDIMMPRMDGMDFLKTLRQESQTPVLVLSGKRGDVNVALGLRLGADDYVFKPFSAEVLSARVEAVLRRASPAADFNGLLKIGSVAVDPGRREVRVAGAPVDLTIKEFNVLMALIAARGKVLSRDHLLSAVWGIGEDCTIRTRTVDQHIAGIRQKLGSEGARILTVQRLGYRVDLLPSVSRP
jgi:DNA-binding response OmpR family regulator